MTLGKNNITNKKIKNNQSLTKKKLVSNPVTNPVDIIAQINSLSPKTTVNKLYAGYNTYAKPEKFVVDYFDFLKKFNEITLKHQNFQDLYEAFHNLFVTNLSVAFTGIGLFNEQSKSIHVKITDKSGTSYTERVFEIDKTSQVMNAYETNKIVNVDDSKFLNIPYLPDAQVMIFPLSYKSENCGVFLVGGEQISAHQDIYNLVNNFLTLNVLSERAEEMKYMSKSTDTLTGLSSHGAFQEKLSDELSKAATMKNSLAVVIFDINNISQINRELGHAKGDEIIRTVADKIVQSCSDKSMIGRYGGDEIAVIMPNTLVDEAKYFSEYVAYSLSCCLIDNVGPIRVSIGISSYPQATLDQEKLLIMAEQAMFISQSKGYHNGMATIISTQDYDFWDDMALSSFASVLTKRHAQVGISFEEELIKKFHNEEIISQNHLIDVVTSLASAIDAKDTYTKGHSTGVAKYSEALARAIGLEEKEIERIKLGAVLHDVGKIGIPENILRKPSALSDEEWAIMKQHPTIGVEKVIKPNRQLHDLIPIVKYHHERYDGKGYPDGIAGTDIPFAARIVSVADAYHALVSDRPYRKGMSIEKACSILKSGAGVQWDKELVRVFVSIAPSLPVI